MKKIFVLFFILSYSLFSYTLPEGAEEIKDDNYLHIEMYEPEFYTISIVKVREDTLPRFMFVIKTPPTSIFTLNELIIIAESNLEQKDYIYGSGYLENVDYKDAGSDKINLYLVADYKVEGAINLFNFLKNHTLNNEKITITFISHSFEEYEEPIPNQELAQDGSKFAKDLLTMLTFYKELL